MIAEDLKKFGLGEYESLALSVVFQKETTAEEISRKSGVPLSKIYSVMRGLEYRGLVKSSLVRPKKFSAVDPDIAFEILLKKHAEQLRVLKALARRAKKALNQNN